VNFTLGDDLTSEALLLNPSGAAAPIDTLTLFGKKAELKPVYNVSINPPAGNWKEVKKLVTAYPDSVGLVSFSEADSPPVLNAFFAITSKYNKDYPLLCTFSQIQTDPITYQRSEDDTAAGRTAAANEFFHRLSQFSNLSNLSGSMLISFVNLLKSHLAFGVTFWPARFSGEIGSWVVPLPRYIALSFPPGNAPALNKDLVYYGFLDSDDPPVIMVDSAGEKLLGYRTEYVKAYIDAIEGLFASDVAAQTASHYLATNAAARELPLDLLKADFYDKVNYIHNIDDLILAPINVNVNDKTSGTPLKDFQMSIPEKIPDPRTKVPTGTAGKTGDGFYYPRARLKQIYEHAMTITGDHLIAKTRELRATGKADINLLLGYRYPTSYGIALAKVDIPNITDRRTTEDTIGKYAVLGTIALYAGIYLANK